MVPCSWLDTIFSDGIKRRIGDKTFPSAVLLDQHVTWMNLHFMEVFEAATRLPLPSSSTPDEPPLQISRPGWHGFAPWKHF
jgi:hypothetical protein